MAGYRVARRYAKGLMSFAKETNQADQVYKEMTSINTALKTNRELTKFLKSPVLDVKRKTVVMEEVFKDFSKTTQTFVKLVINQRREADLKEIANQYIIIYDAKNRIHKAELISAVPLEQNTIDEIVNKAKAIMGEDFNYNIENKVDESLIGGFILRVGDKQIDASVKNKLENLKKEFEVNEYIPKF